MPPKEFCYQFWLNHCFIISGLSKVKGAELLHYTMCPKKSSRPSDAGRWKTLGGPVVIGGDNLPSPGWNRVNWSAPLAPPVPATLDCQIHNNEIKECCYRLICVSINRQFSKRFPSKKKIFTFNNVNEVHIFWPRKTLIKTVLGIFSNLLFSCGCQKHDQIESTRLGTKKLGFFCET